MAAVAVARPSEHGFSQPTSSAGLLAMLDEDESVLQVYALKQLNRIVDEFWAEISAEISKLEALYEDEGFEQRELAALLASKVFYHLGELDESLMYALGAGPLFDVSEETEYVQTLVAKCIDQYVELSVKANESKEKQPPLDPRLVAIVERMLNKCISDGQYQQAVGIALECRRLDKLEEAITKSDDVPALLAYTLRVSQTLVNRREFRHEVLRTLVKLYTHSGSPDYISISQCLMFLDDPAGVAAILDKLVKGDTDDALLAYQVAFDLFENEFQQFLLNVRDRLPDPRGHAEAGQAATEGPEDPAATADGAEAATPATEVSPPTESAATTSAALGASSSAASPAEPKDGASAMDEDAAAPPAGARAIEGLGDLPIATYAERMTRLKGVLSGETPINLALQFLYSRNRADLLVLKNVKGAVDVRNSVCHGAIIYANGLMHAGTTVDTFLRENLEWLSRSTNWAKFSATAGLGVIHRGHLQQGRALMAPYLPQNGVSGSPYSEGGALYALGLIHANHGESIKTFLLESLRNTTNEIIQHGAALGLGLAALGTANEEIFEDLKSVLFTDSANAGEAAGIGMGLLMVGSASEKAGEMLAYAHETQHEKIIRGLALGIALVVYGREEEADTLIEQMTRDQDPILRYGGMYALAMAYRATANNSAIRRLLHFAVSDVSDDVRRTAVMALGFVLCSEPEQCPRIVGLLAESYNPHVRYGAAMAVGIACAGTGLAAALDLLEPLQKDSTDFVRQGALIATAMVLIQETEARQPRVAAFRKHLDKVIGDKHEETMGKMGAILAAGILDAGGRNVTIALRSRSGHDRVTAVVGMAVFTQWWYWYPLLYFLSLTFAPTALIGLNASLQMPHLEVTSAARPSVFAYPAPLSDKKEEEVKKVPTAQLSTTARAKTKAKKDAAEKAEKGKEALEKVAAKGGRKEEEKEGGDAMEVEKEPEAKKVKKEKEPESEALSNPARVIPAQEKYIKFPEGSRYAPLKKVAAGWVLLKDLKPDEPEELVSQQAPAEQGAATAPADAPAAAAGGPAAAADEEEPPPPEPFEFVPQ